MRFSSSRLISSSRSINNARSLVVRNCMYMSRSTSRQVSWKSGSCKQETNIVNVVTAWIDELRWPHLLLEIKHAPLDDCDVFFLLFQSKLRLKRFGFRFPSQARFDILHEMADFLVVHGSNP